MWSGGLRATFFLVNRGRTPRYFLQCEFLQSFFRKHSIHSLYLICRMGIQQHSKWHLWIIQTIAMFNYGPLIHYCPSSNLLSSFFINNHAIWIELQHFLEKHSIHSLCLIFCRDFKKALEMVAEKIQSYRHVWLWILTIQANAVNQDCNTTFALM